MARFLPFIAVQSCDIFQIFLVLTIASVQRCTDIRAVSAQSLSYSFSGTKLQACCNTKHLQTKYDCTVPYQTFPVFKLYLLIIYTIVNSSSNIQFSL